MSITAIRQHSGAWMARGLMRLLSRREAFFVFSVASVRDGIPPWWRGATCRTHRPSDTRSISCQHNASYLYLSDISRTDSVKQDNDSQASAEPTPDENAPFTA